MSKLEELIQELCPDGVKYYELKEIADISTGSHNTNEGVEDGIYPFYVRSPEPLTLNSYDYEETAIITAGDGVGVGKVFHFVNGKYALHQRAYRIHVNTTKVDDKFLYYYFCANFMNYIEKTMFKGSVPSIRRPMLNAFKIPVPPLEVQKEIAHLLDDFTAKTAELQAELNKEYEARKKQYEYYRDQTLTKESLSTNICDKVDDVLQNIDLMCSNLNIELHNDVDSRVKQIELYKSAIENYFDTGKILSLQQEDMENVIMLIQHLFGYIKLTLNEACLSIKDGMHNLPKNTSEVGDYPIISAQNINNDKIDYFAKRYVDIDTYEKENKRTNVTQNDVLLTIVATIGRTALVKEDRPVLLQRSVCVLKPNSILRPSYLKYWLDTSNVQSYMQNNAHGSAQAGLYLKQVGAIEILIPSIEIQDKIVSALDNIRNISNNLQSKISSEIESRQKQYECYRDKLLTFKELK